MVADRSNPRIFRYIYKMRLRLYDHHLRLDAQVLAQEFLFFCNIILDKGLSTSWFLSNRINGPMRDRLYVCSCHK